MTLQRRDFLKTVGLTLATPWLAVACGKPEGGGGTPDAGDPDAPFFVVDPLKQPGAVFSLGIASGDPTPTGVILWTRLDPAALVTGTKLAFEVAADDAFVTVVARGVVAEAELAAAHDHTVKVDLDGKLAAGTRYAYRFIYAGTASVVGHCRTLPDPASSPESLRLVVLTCQDFTNGYYGAFHLVAQEDVDFCVHLGDFIYESAADPRFQSLPFPDRSMTLPSGGTVAMDLEDFRAIYRRYRSDARLQRALAAHTFIMTWDDHETANDCYWDAANNRLGAPDHPYNSEPEKLNGLKSAAQQAWSEFTPARVTFNPSAADPRDALSIYRAFAFGDLAHLVMTDERSYRSAPPCGNGDVGGRYVNTCAAVNGGARSMLGATQRDWLVQQFTGSGALWKLWGNEVLLAPLTVPQVGPTGLVRDASGNLVRVALSLDAWDGYAAERQALLSQLWQGNVRNLLVLTGDLHSTIVARLPIDPALGLVNGNIAGVEFMTPAVTSANLSEIVRGQTGFAMNSFMLSTVMQMNPHLHYLESEHWGYAVLSLTRTGATYKVVQVDKSLDEDPAETVVMRQVAVDAGSTVVRNL